MRYGYRETDWGFHNSGGLVKTSEAAELMARTAGSAVLAGSMVLDRRIGNSPDGEVVAVYDEETQILTNALGMPMPPDRNNPGSNPDHVQPKDFATFAAEDLQEMIDITHGHNKPFILNFGVVSDRPDDELRQVATILHANHIRGIDGFEINPSCPNIVLPDGSRHQMSDNPDSLLPMFQVAATMRENRLIDSYGVRLAPFKNGQAVRPMVELLKVADPDFVSIFNTFPVDPKAENLLQVRQGVGGQSGKGMARRAEEQTRLFMQEKELAEATFQVVGSNGVFDAQTMHRRENLGVDATSGTALFWQATSKKGNHWAEAVNTLLDDYTKAT